MIVNNRYVDRERERERDRTQREMCHYLVFSFFWVTWSLFVVVAWSVNYVMFRKKFSALFFFFFSSYWPQKVIFIFYVHFSLYPTLENMKNAFHQNKTTKSSWDCYEDYMEHAVKIGEILHVWRLTRCCY